jgi:hypothetical protein
VLGHDQDVGVDRALAPTEQDGGGSPGQIDGCVGLCFPRQLSQEASKAPGIG